MDSGKHTQYGWNGISNSLIDGGVGRRTVVLARYGRKHLRGFEVTIRVQRRRCELQDTTSTSFHEELHSGKER
jgi:hypothetical protein